MTRPAPFPMPAAIRVGERLPDYFARKAAGGAELTAWFPSSVRPARPGVYLREFPHRAMFAEWTGHQWLMASRSVRAAKRREVASGQQDTIRWRGLVKTTGSAA